MAPIARDLHFLVTCLLSNAMNGTTRRFAAEDARMQSIRQAARMHRHRQQIQLLKLFIKS
jgi:hypothetical protein